MRLTLALLGWTLDWSLEPTTTTEDDAEDTGAALNGGTLGSTPVDVGEVETWLGETGIEMEPPEDRRVGFR